MRKALLLYNPLSGGRRARHLADVEAAATVLRDAGVEALIAPTQGSSESAGQARQAVAQGVDTVFACGGDGTVHDLVQGMVHSPGCLGIIPLGTANTLAHDIGLPLHPVKAARVSLNAGTRRIAVGQVQYQDLNGHPASRYFIVIVGIGADAHLFYRLNVAAKRRLGMTSYYAKATWLWLTHPLEHFCAEMSADGRTETLRVSQLLAVRIGYFGGVLRELAPGASLDRDDLRLVLFRTRSRMAYLGYILRGLLGTQWRVPGIDVESAEQVQCRPLSPGQRVLVEADGELLGSLPAEITMLPGALNLLVP